MKNRLWVDMGKIIILMSSILLSHNLYAEEDDSFAEHKFVLQISDMDPFKQTLILNVAGNIQKAYGAETSAIEIVAFGPGLRLLFADNSNKGRIKALADKGVRFFACKNTIANMSATLGEPLKLNPLAKSGKGGIVRIKELVDRGYMLAKP